VRSPGTPSGHVRRLSLADMAVEAVPEESEAGPASPTPGPSRVPGAKKSASKKEPSRSTRTSGRKGKGKKKEKDIYEISDDEESD
jgi:hypothetical protein